MSITIVPICHDCNEELSNWDRFLNKKILKWQNYIFIILQ